MGDMPVEFVLTRPTPQADRAPQLDDSQQAVIDHRGGPLLVLAGPGTGKTTTLVELVVDRIARGEVAADQVLMLTFSRKAADDMRARVNARVAAAVGTGHSRVPAMTFHSWCYALVRANSTGESFAAPPVLLTAPEKDAALVELLSAQDLGSWPEDLRQAVRTRGFATELGNFMAALASAGLTTDDLRSAPRSDRADWVRVADAIDEYEGGALFQNVTDYTQIVSWAAGLLADPAVLAHVQSQHRLVVVDEFQDTDPLQVALLQRLVGPDQRFVAVGDPDQSIYGFRGAEPRGVTRFTEKFPGATVLALRHTRRFGEAIRRAAVTVLPALQPGALPASVAAAHRDLVTHHPDPGVVEVLTFTTPGAEADHIAHALRSQHLEAGRAWNDMAVLVRSGADLARLQRALAAADVPVELAGDEIPLVAEPAVRTLLAALETAGRLAAGQEIEPADALALLTGPLAGLDAPALRAAGRALREVDHETSSDVLLTDVLAEPEAWDAQRFPAAHRLARLLADAAAMIARRESPEQVLWHLWDGTDWPARLVRAWEAGGGERIAADRDLDAVCALFHHAERSEERKQKPTVESFIADLRAQQIPADQLVRADLRPNAVRLMTAHRSKGLEWPVVFVAGVQESTWPDLRFRPSILRPDLVAGEGLSRAEQLREERRLFYVALTRAKEQVTVTAVDRGAADDAEAPSRFVTELIDAREADPAFEVHEHLDRPRRAMSLRHAIAHLRALGEAEDEAVRTSAARLLAHLAAQDLGVTRSAHPDTWWGVRDLTQSDVPIKKPDQPLGLSGSSITDITGCSLKWFLAREARGSRGSTTSQGFGLVVHAVAADIVRRGIADPDPATLHRHLDEVWHRLGHETSWISDREKAEAHDALTRFATWHSRNRRQVIGAEVDFTVELELDGQRAVLRGSMDRVELDADGRVHVVDFKTSKKAPSAADVGQHAQLAVYQLAVRHGAVAGHDQPGGSELVQLRIPAGAKDPASPKVQGQAAPPEDDEFFVVDLIRQAMQTMRSEHFVATPATCTFCEFDTVCPARTSFTIGDPS